MNATTLQGDTQTAGGKIEEKAGGLLGNSSLKNQGVADQVTGKANQAIGAAKGFAKQRPFAAAALAGVVGLAVLNTLRGK